MKSSRPISQYQKNNQKQIIQLVLSILVVVTIIFSVLFWTYLSFQRNQDIVVTNSHLKEVIKDLETDLNELSQEPTFNAFVTNVINKEMTPTDFLFYYNNLSEVKRYQVGFVLFDSNLNLVLDNLNDESISQNYALKLMIENFHSTLRILPISNQDSFLVYHRQIVDELQTKGHLMLLVSNQMMSSIITLQPSHFSIINNSSSALLSSDNQYLSGYLRKLDLSTVDDKLINTQNYNENIKIVSFSTRNIDPMLYFLSTVMISLTALLILWVFIKISQRIVSVNSESVNELSHQMKLLQEQKIGQLDIVADDEITEISTQINQLVRSLNETHQTNLELIDIAHESEIKQLIAQFNPHFLYNTLENIRSSMYFDTKVSAKLMTLLVRVLRYALEEKNEVTLKQDLVHLKDYFKILKIRFGDNFNYTLNNQVSNQDVMIPKLIIQPLIENSVKYGFMHQTQLNLKLELSDLEDGIKIVLEDDGPGIDPGKLETVTQPGHHGIYNSKRRVQLLYPHSQFDITNIEPQGARVSIKIRRGTNL